MHEVVDNPSAYGLTNGTDPCFDGVTLCANPGRYLFWDGFHPTTRGHEIIATAIEQAAVPEPSSLLILGSGILGVAGSCGVNSDRYHAGIRSAALKVRLRKSSGVSYPQAERAVGSSRPPVSRLR